MKKLIFILFFFPLVGWTQTANNILLKSIAYHDTESSWSTLVGVFNYTETRPDGPDKKATFEVNNKAGKWSLNRNDEEVYVIAGNEVNVLKGDKEEARGLMLRNYYLYLWGLPMKLMDESTPEITLEEDGEINGVPTYVLRVPYEAETYYFYMDKNSGRMLEYKFYKNEEAGKGELIKLEDEVVFNGLKFPKKRSWYTLPEMKYLGTDILDSLE